ncbi:MAG: glycosyltransferase [Verrucomicrobia bacterium]|nr:glycosyltransferase [Verrucomicrobiota bacterium]
MIPRVSVVLPVYNAAITVARAVESIRAQTWADWELVIVDDGSTDGTREILRGLAEVERRIRLIEREHAGVAEAANAGAAAARGAFIARMDADDVSWPERLARQVEYLEAPASREVGVIGCGVEFGGDRVANAGYALHVDWVNSLVTPEEIALNRFVEQPVVNPSVLFRRELVARHGGYRDGDFPEDYELWLRWLDAGVRIAKVPEVLLTWNDAPTRLTRTDARYAPDAFFRTKAGWISRELSRVADSRTIFVWGAGRHTRKRAAHLTAHGVRIAGYVDVDVKKTGRGIGGTGLPVIGEGALPEPGEIFVLSYVSSRGAREYNRARMVQGGYVEGRDFLLCA